jgi:hypothetical protein
MADAAELSFIVLTLLMITLMVVTLVLLSKRSARIVRLQQELIEKIEEKGMTDVLLHVNGILSRQDHIESRRMVYKAYLHYERNQNLDAFREKSVKSHVDTVRADFDEIGTLLRKKLFDEDLFFDNYSDTVRRCWIALENDIKKERAEKQSDEFMRNFEF